MTLVFFPQKAHSASQYGRDWVGTATKMGRTAANSCLHAGTFHWLAQLSLGGDDQSVGLLSGAQAADLVLLTRACACTWSLPWFVDAEQPGCQGHKALYKRTDSHLRHWMKQMTDAVLPRPISSAKSMG